MTRPAAPRPAPAPARATPARPAPAPAPLQAPYTARFADSIALARQTSTDGKRTYRTSDGQVVELPPDVTVEEAARLEAEAKSAEKQLGKGPPPKPVPDVKKLLPKPAKKESPKPQAKGKKAEGAKGKVKAAAGAAVRLLGAVGKSRVAQYLAARAAPVLSRGIGMLLTLKKNEQTHDSAADKQKQTDKAVVIPPSDGQAKSNAAQVTAVEGRPAPAADEKKAKQTLQQTLADAVPRTIEDVDNFKRDRKAQHVGADVLRVVQGDSNAVVSTFQDVGNTPAPAPPEHAPEPLPPEEIAPPTAQMNLGAGTVAPLQKEHTDVSSYTKEADGKLKEEGVTQEQLDMVDSGDLFEANKEKKGMEAKAKSEPLAIQKLAAREAEAVDKDLRKDEQKERDAIKAKRKEALGSTAKKQKGTKTALEKKREEVAAKINGIYKAAQDKVKKRLADLETESMKRFDDGNAAASRAFEDNVQRELSAFKSRRYSGWFGWAKRAKDWLLGMDDLPEVKAIFDRNRAAFVEAMNALVEGIAADQKKVIQECKDELSAAKKTIHEYVESLGPELKGIGQQAAEEMDAKLGELDQLVARKEQELADRLKDKQAAAVKAIDQKIEKMKEEMSGALSKLGKLLLLAAKKFFTWALEKFGMSLSTIEGIINKGAAVLKAIFTGPIQFVKNLVRAASTGFENFGKNFLTHLKNALFEWLTGSLQGLQLPKTWDLKGILSVVFQMLGITYANFRSHLVKLIPEPVVKGLETTFELVKTLVTEGPMAAWEQLKEIAGEMKEAFVEAIKDWIKWKVVQKAIETILSIFVPGAGILRAIVGIYDTIVFFIQKAKDILQMVGRFLDSIAEIAAGNIGAAASALEAGLARALVLVIDFLARFLRLSGITKKIQEAIAKVRGKVDGVMAKVARWVADQAKKLGKMAMQAGVPQDPKERLKLGREAALRAVNRLSGTRVGATVLRPLLSGIQARYGFSVLDVVARQGRWHVVGQINPQFDEATEALTPESLASSQGGRTLLLGEGNFTFALSIAVKTKIGGRLVATDFMVDERKTLAGTAKENKRNAAVEANIEKLAAMGVEIDRQVDATDPASYPSGTFDIIVFNHPLVLTRKADKQAGPRTLRGGEEANIALVRAFLAAAKKRIQEGGKIILISSKYRLQRWKLDTIAKDLGLEQTVMKFLVEHFPEYFHEKTEASGGAETVESSQQFAIVFTIKANPKT